MGRRALRDELMTLLVAGQETSAILLAWACAYLAHHPEQQERAASEARQVCLAHTSPILDTSLRMQTQGSPVPAAQHRRLCCSWPLSGAICPYELLLQGKPSSMQSLLYIAQRESLSGMHRCLETSFKARVMSAKRHTCKQWCWKRCGCGRQPTLWGAARRAL